MGPGIASMAVLLIERAFGLRFADMQRSSLDVKPDVHVRRVLYRLGMAPTPTEQAALQAARELHPSYPGELDAPLWWLGRQRCFAKALSCGACPMAKLCPKTSVKVSRR